MSAKPPSTQAAFWRRLLRTKPLDDASRGGELGRTITLFQLVMLGVDSTIGTGIGVVQKGAILGETFSSRA